MTVPWKGEKIWIKDTQLLLLRDGKIYGSFLYAGVPFPSWLMPIYVREGFIIITEKDLYLKEKEITAYMELQSIDLTQEERAFICKKCQGNAYAVRHTALKIWEGMRPGPELEREVEGAFVKYL